MVGLLVRIKMLDYIENIPLEQFKNYKYVIYKVSEYVERGFSSDEYILDYFASKGEATLYVKRRPDFNEKYFYIASIGVK